MNKSKPSAFCFNVGFVQSLWNVWKDVETARVQRLLFSTATLIALVLITATLAFVVFVLLLSYAQSWDDFSRLSDIIKNLNNFSLSSMSSFLNCFADILHSNLITAAAALMSCIVTLVFGCCNRAKSLLLGLIICSLLFFVVFIEFIGLAVLILLYDAQTSLQRILSIIFTDYNIHIVANCVDHFTEKLMSKLTLAVVLSMFWVVLIVCVYIFAKTIKRWRAIIPAQYPINRLLELSQMVAPSTASISIASQCGSIRYYSAASEIGNDDWE